MSIKYVVTLFYFRTVDSILWVNVLSRDHFKSDMKLKIKTISKI